jgi:HK97 family phage major capsid protein
MTQIIELKRKRLTAIDEARGLLRDMRAATDEKTAAELSRKHDAAMLDIDALDLDIREADALADEEAATIARRPDMSGEGRGVEDGRPAGYWPFKGSDIGWRNAKGEPVRVLGSRENFATRSDSGLSVGDIVRARITGPRNDEEKRALSEGTDSAGGFTVPTPLASRFIDLMRSKSVAIRAGAMTVPMDSETLAMARLASDPTVAWRAENAAIAEGDPTFDRVTFTAKTLAGQIKISRELAADSVNVGAMIENALAQASALKLDQAAIWGAGTDNSPTGVYSTSGINSVSMGANGAALTDYDKVLDAIYELQLDNAEDPTAMIMHPRTNLVMAKFKDGDSNPLSPPEMVARVPRLLTTSASIAETQGSASNASSIVVGDFRHLMIGMRHQLEIRVYDQPLASTGQLLVVAWLRADVQLVQPKSFCKLVGIIPAA